jgi:Zn-ribbon protein, possibly nucleic acid-binding
MAKKKEEEGKVVVKNTKKKAVEKEQIVPNNEEIGNVRSPEELAEEISIAKKLLSLYNLQQIWSKIDKIRVIRGELPNEVRDLEDAFEGMNTRIAKYTQDVADLENKIIAEENKMKDSLALITRYEEQQNNVRNNREYESLTKEIEYQKLEIQVAEKYKTKFQAEIVAKKEDIENFESKLTEINDILQQKKSELDAIIADTEKEEKELLEAASALQANIEQRLLSAFERIRKNARNGLAIVQIDRDACGGCFSMIPPQRQMDIMLHKKIIVCEACGRIFIDHQLVEETQNETV